MRESGEQGEEDGKEGESEGTGGRAGLGWGGGSWRFVLTFFGFQLLQHPCLLALFAVGL